MRNIVLTLIVSTYLFRYGDMLGKAKSAGLAIVEFKVLFGDRMIVSGQGGRQFFREADRALLMLYSLLDWFGGAY